MVRHPIPSDTTVSEDLERKLDFERHLHDKVWKTNEINWAHALATVDCQDALWCQLQAVQPEDPTYPLEQITLDTTILPCLMVEVLNVEWIPHTLNEDSDEDEQWLKFVGASKYGDPKIPDQVRPPPPIYVVQEDPQRVKAKQQYKIKTPTHKWTRHTGECLDLIEEDLVKEPPIPLKPPPAKRTRNNLSRRALREKMKQTVEMIEHHARIRENGASSSSSSSGC